MKKRILLLLYLFLCLILLSFSYFKAEVKENKVANYTIVSPQVDLLPKKE